jgi:hypothetical protein
VEQESQTRPLVLGTRDHSAADNTSTLSDEVSGKRRSIEGRGVSHDASPFARYVRNSGRTLPRIRELTPHRNPTVISEMAPLSMAFLLKGMTAD